MSNSSAPLKDACGDYGPNQRWAAVWFFGVLIIGLIAISTLRNTDFYNYSTNGEFYDYAAYRSNKVGALYIGSDAVDERAHGDLASVTAALASDDAAK